MIARVPQLVDEGIRLRCEIAKLEEQLAGVEECLISLAKEGDQLELTDADREGKQFLAHGSEVVVPVVFTADLIMKTFKDQSTMQARLATIAGPHERRFYAPVRTWEMVPKGGKQFRHLAGELLGKDGPALVTACLARDKHGIPKSDIKIEWKRAEGIKTK